VSHGAAEHPDRLSELRSVLAAKNSEQYTHLVDMKEHLRPVADIPQSHANASFRILHASGDALLQKLDSLELQLAHGQLALFDKYFESVPEEAASLPADMIQKSSIYERIGTLRERRRRILLLKGDSLYSSLSVSLSLQNERQQQHPSSWVCLLFQKHRRRHEEEKDAREEIDVDGTRVRRRRKSRNGEE
jgi:hypothetical protein